MKKPPRSRNLIYPTRRLHHWFCCLSNDVFFLKYCDTNFSSHSQEELSSSRNSPSLRSPLPLNCFQFLSDLSPLGEGIHLPPSPFPLLLASTGLIAILRSVRYIMDFVRGLIGVAISTPLVDNQRKSDKKFTNRKQRSLQFLTFTRKADYVYWVSLISKLCSK